MPLSRSNTRGKAEHAPPRDASGGLLAWAACQRPGASGHRAEVRARDRFRGPARSGLSYRPRAGPNRLELLSISEPRQRPGCRRAPVRPAGGLPSRNTRRQITRFMRLMTAGSLVAMGIGTVYQRFHE